MLAQHRDRPVDRPPGGEPAQIHSAAGGQPRGAGLLVDQQAVAAGGLAGRGECRRRRQRALPELVEHPAQRAVGALRPEAEVERLAQHRQGRGVDRQRIPAGGGVEAHAHRHRVGLGRGQFGHRGAQRGLGGGGAQVAHLDPRRLLERLAAGAPAGCRPRQSSARPRQSSARPRQSNARPRQSNDRPRQRRRRLRQPGGRRRRQQSQRGHQQPERSAPALPHGLSRSRKWAKRRLPTLTR